MAERASASRHTMFIKHLFVAGANELIHQILRNKNINMVVQSKQRHVCTMKHLRMCLKA